MKGLTDRISTRFADTICREPLEVKTTVEDILALALDELKKSGSVKLASMLSLKLKIMPMMESRNGVKQLTKTCVVKPRTNATHDVIVVDDSHEVVEETQHTF